MSARSMRARVLGGAGGAARRAYTVIEILFGLLIGLLVIGVVVGLMWIVQSGFTRSEDRLDARERAHLALTAIRLVAQDAWYYAIDHAHAAIVLEGPRGQSEIRLDSARHQLLARMPGEASLHALTGPVAGAFEVKALRPGVLSLALTILRPGSEKLGRLPPLLVSQEILLPCIAWRSSRIPWVRVLEPSQALVASR